MKITNLIIAVLFWVSLVSAANFVFTQGEAIDLKISCFDENNDFCNSSVICNITVLRPNHEVIINNQQMTFNTAFFNLTLNSTDTSALGEYSTTTICTGNTTGFSTFSFDVTPTGTVLSTGESVLYLLFLFLLAVTFFTTLFWSIRLPFKNVRNAEGEIISVNDLKYLQVFLIAITYVLLMWIFGILQAVTKNFLVFFGIDRVFFWLYTLMLSFLIPGVVLTFLFALLLVINDKRLIKALERFDFR